MTTKHAPPAALLLLLFLCACTSKQDKAVLSTAANANDPETLVEARDPLLRLVPASESGVVFQNVIEESLQNNMLTNPNIYNGGGVAVADVNNDNLPDLYFLASTGKCMLYLNEGNFKFKDITDRAGLACPDGFKTSVTVVDINADGWLDFYVCRSGHHLAPEQRADRLYVNNRDLTFTEQAAAYGLADKSLSTGANFFDYDLDGDLDLFLLTTGTNGAYSNQIESVKDPATGKLRPVLTPKTEYDTDRLYRNDGGRFVDVTKKAGLYNVGFGLSATVSDFNGDGYPDLYVGNDFIEPDQLYLNNGNGTFTDRLAESMEHTTQHTMGVDIADFDNDARVDLVALDMLPYSNRRLKLTTNTNSQSRQKTLREYGYFEPVVRNVLQRNNGPVKLPNGQTGVSFSDIACLAGVYNTDWSWSCLFADLDNDGHKDLTISNGYRRDITNADFINFTFPEIGKRTREKPFATVQEMFEFIPEYKVRNFVFRNKADWTFEEMSGKWMTNPPAWSNGTVYADLDADGDLDWIVNNVEEPPFIYDNRASGRPNSHFLQLELTGGETNPFAVGATAVLWAGGEQQYLELTPTRGIFSSVEHLLHFGLGSRTQVDSLIVRWPNGQTTRLQNLPADQRLALKQGDATAGKQAALFSGLSSNLAWQLAAGTGLDFRHTENVFDDFDFVFLQPWHLSELGPVLASADVDADGLDDVFIGNAFDSPGALYRQLPDGRFQAISGETWKPDAIYEDQGAVFFDFENDGDHDLFVVSGGQETRNELAWQSRLYLNDGRGKFTKAADAVPNLKHTGMRVAAHDYDDDGDQDLFIGGRVTSLGYPQTPRSGVLRNDGAKFTDVTEQVGGDFRQCGMVADLVWANVDADPAAEMIVVGEWMPVTVFEVVDGVLKNKGAGLGFEKSDGLWNRLAAADVDGDGDQDLVTGNFGLNSSLRASADEPLRCLAKDFDGNGSIDPLLACYDGGRLVPFRQKDAIIKQIPSLKKKFVYAKDYSQAAMTDLYPQDVLESAQNLYAYTLATTWWENQGGKFVAHVLPAAAQTSPVLGIAVEDFNGDGRADLFLVGNKYGVEVEIGRADAGTGCLLVNNGSGQFTWVPNIQTGLWARKQARDVAVLRGANGQKTVVVANNNDRVEVYRSASAQEDQ
jgi:hypothetical protein